MVSTFGPGNNKLQGKFGDEQALQKNHEEFTLGGCMGIVQNVEMYHRHVQTPSFAPVSTLASN